MARLNAAHSKFDWRNGDIRFIVTGNVPYRPGGKTLSELSQEHLARHGVPPEKIEASEGTGIYSQARILTDRIRSLPDSPTLYIVTSRWCLWTVKPIWKKYGKGLRVLFYPIPGRAGTKQILIYFCYGVVIRIARVLGLENRLAGFLTAQQEKRKTRGFTWNGCGWRNK